MDYNRSFVDLPATVISAAGHVAGDILPFKTASQNGSVAGVLLGVGTYRFVVGSPSGDSEVPAQVTLVSVQLAWQATVAGQLVVKTCDFPGALDKFGRGAVDVSDFDTTFWIQQNPTNSYVPVSGTGNTATLAVVTAGGTNVGNADFTISAMGPRRLAIEIVTTVGGIVRACACGKLGS